MRIFTFLLSFSFSLLTFGQQTVSTSETTLADSLVRVYQLRMDSLGVERRRRDVLASRQSQIVALNPYFYRILAPGTYYSNPLHQAFSIPSGNPVPTDWALTTEAATGAALAQLYVSHPNLIVRTEKELREEQSLREEVSAIAENTQKLSDKVKPVNLNSDDMAPAEFHPRRPNFWTFKGNGSLQFTQSYFSKKWYQGGQNNYAALTTFTFDANFNNKQKIQWDNRLEAQLGFQTNPDDQVHKFRATSNLLRITSKLGYQAAKSWYYTAQVTGNTQLVPNYNGNSDTYSSCFGAPLNMNVSVGMDYKFKSKKGKFSGSLYIAPVAWNSQYVLNDSLRYNRYTNVYRKGKHDFGPSLTMNYSWTVCKNVSWSARIFYFCAPFDEGKMYLEWENTISFTINKYLSSKLYLYPRFDNRSDNYKGKHGYLMFKEWLSLGLNYNF